MGRRQDFHAILEALYDDQITDANGQIASPCVKYQPGASVKLTWPAIVYKLSDMPSVWANNLPYHWDHKYEVQVIDRKADSVLRERVIALPMCKFVRSMVVDNLYHYTFNVCY